MSQKLPLSCKVEIDDGC